MPIAVVTGGAGGLGAAIARRLIDDGMQVVVVDVDLSATKTISEELGDRSLGIVADVSQSAELEAAFATIHEALGAVSVLINNAAIYPTAPFLEAPMDLYDEVVAVNQRAYFQAAQLASRDMVEMGGGAIVNISSITVHGGWEHLAPYVSTKAAAIGLTRALARELGPHGIRVNGVAPGAFPTAAEAIHPDPAGYNQFVLDRQSLKRRGDTTELAAVVSFLVGPDSSFLTGQTIGVDGGWVMT
jgi:NAD(P)-dependent dehydrogenase (short-subunit alcohol dehydrogenase family)